ncbi:hypothetical protein [Nocardia sp. NPDC056000]|uniref:TPR repeat region-containing protein n=1 Tax=Nocardia sp. NPDC056000 TaxID=3345674 RepID=UPI0035E1A78B
MTTPTRSQAEVIVLDLDEVATRAESIATTLRGTADDLDGCIDGMSWSGEGRKGAEHRAGSERQQMRTLATAFENLATACNTAQTTLAPILETMRTSLAWLRKNSYEIAEDWSVTDKLNYGAAFALVKDDQPGKDRLNRLKADRADEAANQTVALQRLAASYGIDDDTCAQAIGKAVADMGTLAPASAGLSPALADSDLTAFEKGQATPEQIARLQAATHLTDQQLDDLRAGRQVDITQGQFDYAREIMRDLDNLSVEQIDHLADKLPPSQQQPVRAGIADALQMMSNPQIGTSGGAQDGQPADRPDHGGMMVLPTQVRTLLTDNPQKAKSLARADTAGASIEVPRLNDFKALNELLGSGDAKLARGTDIDRGLLKQGAEIAGSRAQHIYGSSGDTPSSVADMLLSRAGIDNTAVNDFLTGGPTLPGGTHRMDVTVTQGGHYDVESHVADVINHDWDGHDAGISKVITTAGEFATDPNDTLRAQSGTSVHALASYIGQHGDDLLHIKTLTGPKEFGIANPGMAQALASTLSPYIPDMAGVRSDLLHTSGFTHDIDTGQLKNVFAVIDSDQTAATQFNSSAYAAVSQLNQQFGTTGAHDYRLPEWAGSIDAAARDGMQLELETRGLQAAANLKAQTMMFDSVREGVAFSAKQIPLVGAAVELEVKASSPEVKAWLLGSVPNLHETVDLTSNANPAQRYYNILEGMTQLPDHPDFRSDQNVGRYFDPNTGKLKSFEEIAGTLPRENLPEFDSAMRNLLPGLANYDASWANGHDRNGVPHK